MGYFILAAILSTLFFAIILFVEPIGEHLLRRLGEPLQERIGITILRILFGLIALVVPFAFLWLISGIVHPPTSLTATVSTIVFSPQSRSALLGVVFGALFLVWIARLYATQASPKPKGPQKDGEPAASAEAGQGLPRLLVVEGYFLLALFVAGSLDVLNPILQRISGLKLFGAELSLTNPGPTESPNAQPLATGPAGDSDRVPARAGTALNFLSAIDALMRRDNVLGPLARRPMSPAPPAAIKLAHDAIAPLAACHAALYSVTRSPRFMTQAFAGLDGPVHALALAAEYRVDQADRAALTKEVAEAYAEAATRAIEGAYVNDISLYRKARARPDAPQAGAATVEVDPSIRENCSDLLAFACLKTGARPFCADDIVPRDGPSRAAIRKAFADAFSDLVDDALAQDEDADRRPYFAIVAASVSSLLGQPQAAVAELDRWTTLHATAPVTWNNLRAMSTLASFTEDWLRSSRQASETQALQEFYLDTLARLIAEFRDIPAIDAAYLAFRRKTKGVPTLDFDIAPIDSAHCSLGAPARDPNDPAMVEANAAYTILTYMQSYVDRALDRPDFVTSPYAENAEIYLKELNVVDLGCLELKYPDLAARREASANFRADVLRLNARSLLVGLAGSQSVRTADDVKGVLQRALDATLAGKGFLRKARKEALYRREAARFITDKLSPSNVLETYDELDALEKRISARLAD